MNDKIRLGSNWFALTKENGKGIRHQIVAIEKDEDADISTIPQITTFSLVEDGALEEKDESKIKNGYTWHGPEDEFLKLFKFIGFSNKK